MSSPVQDISVICPSCHHTFTTWHRASLNLQLDNFDEDYIRSATLKVCPQCRAEIRLNSLIVGRDGIWRVAIGENSKRYTLHEAMRMVLLEQPEHSATMQFLSDEIAERHLYRQKGGGIAHSGQIRIRAIKYARLFEVVDGDIVRLIEPKPVSE